MEHFRPPGLRLYKPEKMLVWVQKIDELPEGENTNDWPAKLPSLASLWENRQVPEYMDELEPGGGHVLFEEPDTDMFLQAFGSRITDGYYLVEDQLYLVIIRPIFPHESVETFPWGIYPWGNFPDKALSFELPFKCDD